MKKVLILLTAVIFTLTSIPGYSQDYRVGEGDVLKISVYGNPDLDSVVRVSNKGVIMMPLIGPVEVGDMTIAGITKKLTDLFADGYLKNPHVSVFVQEFRSKKVTILGEVNRPGLYEISGDTSFLELVSKAQGFTKTAGKEAVIKRKQRPDQQNPEIVRVDLKDLIERGGSSGNLWVEDGDSIYIKEAKLFYMNGEVRNPDAYKWEEGMTIIKAITFAGGLTAKASPKNIRIIRKVDGQEKVLTKAKMDEPVLPEDVIVVPESFF